MTRADRATCVTLAIVAAVWHALLMTRATNDNFLHLTLAQQWLAGDWPVRDFFDQGWVLQYSLSAAGQLLSGGRLAGEAGIVGLAWAISTGLLFVIVRRLTGSSVVAVASALLPIVAGARGYSYPKGIAYAVAAWLWWRYVDQPSTRRVVVFGVWAAIAFYWRPDHGIYVAIGLALATLAAHGFRAVTLARCCAAAVTMIVCIAPFLLYVQAIYGVVAYARIGLVQAEVEHESHGTHEWPLVRYGTSLVTVEPADRYAPTVGIRWRPDSSFESRQRLLAQYGLTTVASEERDVIRVRLSEASLTRIRPLINEPIVDDTSGIDRSAGTLGASTWPASERWKFRHWWLRLQVLPELDRQTRASEFAAALFFLCPLLLLLAAVPIAHRLPAVGRAQHLVAFAVFALVVSWAMVRNPFPARVADAVVLSAIAFGCCLGALWRPVGTAWTRRAAARLGAIAIATAVVVTVAQAGRFESPLRWPLAAGDAYRELTASPPLAHYVDRRARFTLRLAAYVRDCVPERDRLLVLWFEPEIYYYSERLMAQRLGVYAPEWATLEREQQLTLEKITRFAPPIVLARQSALDEYARAAYPGVMDYIAREYRLAATVRDGGEEYLIYARRDRPALRAFDSQSWPCYTPTASQWERVGGAGAAAD